MTSTTEEPEAGLSAVDRCAIEIRRMILVGQLLPGQKVNQADLAEQLGMSRIPVREALTKLQTEGLLTHKANTGFAISRFSAEDLSEIYLMRRLLETELLRSIDLAEVDVHELEALHHAVETVSPRTSPEEYQRLNEAFHFFVFGYSPLVLLRQEVSRLWYISSFYRFLHLHEADASHRLSLEHQRIVDAVREQDADALIDASDSHRAGTEAVIVQRLGRSRSE